MNRKSFSSDLRDLPHMLSWISSCVFVKGMDQKTVRRLTLAAEEALVNIIQHAYQDQKGKIEISVISESRGVEIAIKDFGPPFDPLSQAPEVDPEAPIEQRKEGGLGVYLMKQLTDEVIYRREEDGNLLTLVKHFS